MQSIDLALCCDDNYAKHLGVALCSVLHNLSPDTRAGVYIVHNGLRQQNREYLEALLDTYGARGMFIVVGPERLEGLVISRHITPAAYIRIALADLLPPEVSRVLYLDCDLVALGDITPLATADMGGFALAAIPEGDQCSWSMNDLRHHARIPHDALYFNSGVLLMDLEKWRAGSLSEKIFRLIREESHRIRLHDQDALNIFFHNAFKPLDSRWNYTVQHLERPEIYGAEPVSIAHFITGVKPWHAECDHPMRDAYFKYLALTPWDASAPPRADEGGCRSVRVSGTLKQVWRKIRSIIAARRAIRSSAVFRKDDVIRLRTRLAVKSMFINAGILKRSRENVLGRDIRFYSYEAFMRQFDEIFIENRYYFEATSTKPSMIDCSGDIGLTTLYFKELYPYSNIIVFEPDRELFGILEENVHANNFEGVQLVNSSVSGHDFGIELGGSGPEPISDTAGPAETPCGCNGPRARLSSYIQGPVDFLKLDCREKTPAIIEDLARSGKLGMIKKIFLRFSHGAYNNELSAILTALDHYGLGYRLRAAYPGCCTRAPGTQEILIFASDRTAG